MQPPTKKTGIDKRMAALLTIGLAAIGGFVYSECKRERAERTYAQTPQARQLRKAIEKIRRDTDCIDTLHARLFVRDETGWERGYQDGDSVHVGRVTVTFEIRMSIPTKGQYTSEPPIVHYVAQMPGVRSLSQEVNVSECR